MSKQIRVAIGEPAVCDYCGGTFYTREDTLFMNGAKHLDMAECAVFLHEKLYQIQLKNDAIKDRRIQTRREKDRRGCK